jgi:hypothetical protein
VAEINIIVATPLVVMLKVEISASVPPL